MVDASNDNRSYVRGWLWDSVLTLMALNSPAQRTIPAVPSTSAEVALCPPTVASLWEWLLDLRSFSVARSASHNAICHSGS